MFIATQLNWPSWTAYSQVSRVFVYDVTTYKLSQLLFTLWTCRQLDVELSSVELSWVVLCRYKRALREASNISFKGVVILILVSYKILGCSPSGPGDFETLSFSNIFNIFSSWNSVSRFMPAIAKCTKLTVRWVSWKLTTAQSEQMIPHQRSNPSFTVGMKSGVSQAEEGRHHHSLFSGSSLKTGQARPRHVNLVLL